MRVRAGFDRVLLLDLPVDEETGALPVTDSVTGLHLVGLTFFVRFDRVFEVADDAGPEMYPRTDDVVERAEELNALLRVSFDRDHGLRFWPEESLGCGFEVVSWLAGEPSAPWTAAPRPVGREVFEGLLERLWDVVTEDYSLQSTAYMIDPVDPVGPVTGAGPSLVGSGGGRGA